MYMTMTDTLGNEVTINTDKIACMRETYVMGDACTEIVLQGVPEHLYVTLSVDAILVSIRRGQRNDR